MNNLIYDTKDDRNPSMYDILSGICKGEIWSFRDEPLVLDIMYSYCVGGCGVVGRIPGRKRSRPEYILKKYFLL